MSRKICIVTGSRAEYGLLRWVIEGVRESLDLELQIIATGMHLAPKFGLTYREIEKDGFCIDHKIDMLLNSDTPAGVAKSMGLGLIEFGKALQKLQPDLMLVLGDRFEVFSAVAAALIARIPVAHIHGGESTEGAFDEAIRHSITKMSHLHFVAAEEYRKRVIQLGEHPDRVFLVGGLGVDNIKKLDLLDRAELETTLDFQLGAQNLLITFHPVTLENSTSAEQMAELIVALKALDDTHLIFTMPNADTNSRILIDMVNRFVSEHPHAQSYTSLGQLRYLSCIKHVDGVVGNSSSGLAEVPSFGKGTVNIGDRQRGRLKAASVIDCDPEQASITSALKKLYTKEFQLMLKTVKNPYGEGGASGRVVDALIKVSFKDVLKKSFFDLSNK
jgi:GDP/UDP-N,N'-diacetylbacillosamine 2-epimerase (hydrolysing)